jgi:hypothetical protein
MKYNLIVLIISSHELPVYNKFKQISNFYYSLYPNKIKHFYVEMKEDLNEDIIETDNHIYVKGKHCFIPCVYIKTIKAIEYVNKKYDYDFLLRTGLSTFCHMNNFLNFFQKIPKQNFACGPVLPWGVISGTSIIVSKDVADILVKDFVTNSAMNDDNQITEVIRRNNVPICDICNYGYKQEYLIDNNYNENYTFDENKTLSFRINNSQNREEYDIKYMKLLSKKIYNIQIN